jgi:hypothetical protein
MEEEKNQTKTKFKTLTKTQTKIKTEAYKGKEMIQVIHLPQRGGDGRGNKPNKNKV